MGHGFVYKCKKCGKEYEVCPGIGFNYPKEYQKLVKEIISGKHGTELKELFEKTPYAAINGERIVYVCGKCNRWEVGVDFTVYAPNNPELIEKKEYGIKTVEEWGYVPYVMLYDLKNQYHVIKRVFHKCKKCGKRMHKATEKELKTLRCPKCGTINETLGEIMWD